MFFCARLAFSGSAVSLEQLLLNIRRALFSPSRRAIVLFHSVTHLPANPSTACGHRMAHRKWKENKLQPGTAGPSNMLGCSLISFHFRWAILCPQAVQASATVPPLPSFLSCVGPLVRSSKGSNDCCEVRSAFCGCETITEPGTFLAPSFGDFQLHAAHPTINMQ